MVKNEQSAVCFRLSDWKLHSNPFHNLTIPSYTPQTKTFVQPKVLLFLSLTLVLPQ